MNTVDLHVHSTKSDGTLSPTELVEYAVKKGLAAIALTDHDTVDGIDEALAAAENKNITVIPGIEFSSEYEGIDVHIVGLFIDHNNPFFKERLEHFVNSRTNRNKEMCDKLQDAGIDITFEKLTKEFPDCVITRSHYAAYLLNHGYTKYHKEAFERYIGDRGPCFVPRKKITPFRAVEIILKAGGLPVLAHPVLYHMSDARLNKLVSGLTAVGLAGIEAVYCSHSPSEERQIRKLAAKYHLCISGGSDFHGDTKPGLDLGNGYGKLFIPESVLADLQQELHKRQENPQDYRPHKILFTDLDGTLLNDQKQISSYTREMLDAWCAAGHRLVLCSGRDINSVNDVKNALELNYPGMLLIGYNGGQIYDCDKKETLYKVSLSLEQVKYIMAEAKKQGVHCHTYSDTHIISPDASEELAYYQHAIKTPVIIADDVLTQLTEGPCKCIAVEINDHSRLEHFRDSIKSYAGEDIALMFSSKYYLEIFPAASGKGAALQKLCELLNIPIVLTVAAGDQENDLSMIQSAGYSIAMQNGSEAVKKAATIVTAGDNNHDGLAHALISLI